MIWCQIYLLLSLCLWSQCGKCGITQVLIVCATLLWPFFIPCRRLWKDGLKDVPEKIENVAEEVPGLRPLGHALRLRCFDLGQEGRHVGGPEEGVVHAGCKQIIKTIEEETDRREGKGRRCCFRDVLECHTSHLLARMIWSFWKNIHFGRLVVWFAWCEPDDHQFFWSTGCQAFVLLFILSFKSSWW